MKIKKKNISNILLLAFFIALAWYIKENKEDFIQLRYINLWYILGAIILRILQLFLSGAFIKIIVNKYLVNNAITTFESFYISVFSAVGNFFGFMQSGAGIRAVYLKTKYGLSLSKFTMTILIHYTITFLVFGTAGLVALFCLGNLDWRFIIPMFILSYGALGFVMVNRIKLIDKIISNKVFKRFHNLFELLRQLPSDVRQKPGMFVTLSFLYVLRFMLAMMIQLLFFKSIDIDVSFFALMLYTSLSRLPIIVNITPAALGFREAILLLAQNLVSLDTSSILKLAIIERTIFVIVLTCTFILTSLVKKTKFASE